MQPVNDKKIKVTIESIIGSVDGVGSGTLEFFGGGYIPPQ